MNDLTILTYNLLYNKAHSELLGILKKEKPDVVCVQEFIANQTDIAKIEALGYSIADYSHSFYKFFRFYSIATFYDPKKFTIANGEKISLKRGLYEFILFVLGMGKTERTALNTTLIHKESNKTIDIYNLHLTPLTGTNGVRKHQIKTTFEHFKRSDKINPAIVTGDFNYPYKRKGLEEITEKYGYKEATNDLFFTIEGIYFTFFRLKAKTDYIFYDHLKKKSVRRLSRKVSDHFPILAKFTL